MEEKYWRKKGLFQQHPSNLTKYFIKNYFHGAFRSF